MTLDEFSDARVLVKQFLKDYKRLLTLANDMLADGVTLNDWKVDNLLRDDDGSLVTLDTDQFEVHRDNFGGTYNVYSEAELLSASHGGATPRLDDRIPRDLKIYTDQILFNMSLCMMDLANIGPTKKQRIFSRFFSR